MTSVRNGHYSQKDKQVNKSQRNLKQPKYKQ